MAAGRKAFLDALSKASPQVLEPIVAVEVSAPESYMGDIAGDLASRRGQVTNTEGLPGGEIQVMALVPLAELENYATRLHALTQHRRMEYGTSKLSAGSGSQTGRTCKPLSAQRRGMMV